MDLTQILKVGQTIYSIQIGECEVVSLNSTRTNGEYPIEVTNTVFGHRNYTIKGQYFTADECSSLLPKAPKTFTLPKNKKQIK